MAQRHLRRSLKTFIHDFPEYELLISALPYLPTSTRKVIITLSRIQYLPYEFEIPQMADHWRSITTSLRERLPPETGLDLSLWELLYPHKNDFESPLTSGFISMLARTIPSSVVGANYSIIQEDREKELLAALTLYHPVSFNWDALFDGIPIPIAEGYPYSMVHKTVFHGMLNAKAKISGRTFYPSFSLKTVGRESKAQLRFYKDGIEDVLIDESTRGLEVLYSRTGIELDGVTEMRTAFTLNDLRPRSYYARGPSVYYPSRFVQPIFNILIDMFPVTHRRARFILSQLQVEPSESLFIYDYSSFTSTLFEIRNFTEALSRYFSDTTITVIDSFVGPTECNLGDLLHDFNESCNNFPEFSCPDFGDSSTPSCSTNFHKCGMLGVPGNISSCTLLHGIHLAILLCSTLCRCVGDDAIGKEKRELVEKLISDFLPNIGHVSLEKSTIWDFTEEEDSGDMGVYTSWHYTKRPITRFHGQPLAGKQAIYPPITFVLQWKDDLRTFSWPETDELFVKKAAHYIRRFGTQFISFPSVSEYDEAFSNRFIRAWNRCLKNFVDREVSSGFEQPRVYKCLVHHIGQNGFEDMVWSMTKNGWMNRVSKRSYGFDEDTVCRGYRYSSQKTQALSFAMKLGYADMEEEYEMIASPQEFFNLYTSQYADPTFMSSYSWILTESCPSWLVTLVRESLIHLPSVEDEENLYYDSGSDDDTE